MTDEQALDELSSIADALDLNYNDPAPTFEELRALAARIRECSEAL